jgi:hypothetical protein
VTLALKRFGYANHEILKVFSVLNFIDTFKLMEEQQNDSQTYLKNFCTETNKVENACGAQWLMVAFGLIFLYFRKILFLVKVLYVCSTSSRNVEFDATRSCQKFLHEFP